MGKKVRSPEQGERKSSDSREDALVSEAENEVQVNMETGEVIEPEEAPEEEPVVEEEPDTPEEEEGVEDVPPEQQAVKTEKEIEAFWRGMERYRQENADRVAKRAGDEAVDLVLCPACGDKIPGFVWNPDEVPPDPDHVAALRLYIGMPDLEQFEQAPDATGCPDCKSRGWVKTGSDVENFTLKQCSRCAGKGYIGTGITVLPETGFAANGATDPAPVAAAPPVETDLPPELEQYRAQGWMVVPPFSAAPG